MSVRSTCLQTGFQSSYLTWIKTTKRFSIYGKKKNPQPSTRTSATGVFNVTKEKQNNNLYVFTQKIPEIISRISLIWYSQEKEKYSLPSLPQKMVPEIILKRPYKTVFFKRREKGSQLTHTASKQKSYSLPGKQQWDFITLLWFFHFGHD